ncbi:hypothetical protein CVT24_000035 [Panaeolus cyanescens]|uniref:Uncharacterized protein n=1 Tax=Panaeolus cyanescens TaxID=181874 RepID=A0A409W7E1_9AGAR|nr:hypothetical protein CVT24_000035 [Panaeolus cyanescens]
MSQDPRCSVIATFGGPSLQNATEESLAAIQAFLIDTYLTVADLMNLSKVSCALRFAVREYTKIAYSIDDHLAEFFNQHEIPLFRLLQKETGLLISGSFALRFLTRQYFDQVSDLDLYIEDRYGSMALRWLSSIGYARSSRQPPRHRPQCKIRAVFTLERRGKTIQVIATRSSAFSVILDFHSTCVMNVITSDYAVSLYPQATLHHMRSVVLHRQGWDERRSAGPLLKYENRGYEIVYTPEESDISSRNSDFFIGRRYLGDSMCWTLELETGYTGLGNPVNGNSWELSWSTSRPGRLTHRYLNLNLPSLKFRYAMDHISNHQVVTLLGRKPSR